MAFEKIHQYLKEEKENLTSPFDFLLEQTAEEVEKEETDKLSNLDDEQTAPHLTKKEKELEQEEDNFTSEETSDLNKDKSGPYGQECVLDLHEVPLEMFNNKALKQFGEELCKEIGMSLGPAHSWGNDHDEGMYKPNDKQDDKKDGISHVQFLWESSIVIHALDELQKVFVNVFSCKKFDSEKAKDFTVKYFGGKLVNETNIIRK